jgi:hypothetical protein
MTRQTRLIAILAVMALAGVVALGLVADRYRRVISGRQQGATQSADQALRAAQAQVDAFLSVRRALRARIDDGGFEGLDTDTLAREFIAERDRLRAASRLGPADYRELRQRYRQWKQDTATADAAWRAAFAAREREFEACILGELESLDR